MGKQLISIVTPCYNEEGNVLNHFARVRMAIAPFETTYDFEHIYTDNCSQDKTFEILQRLGREHSNVRAMRFSRNIGGDRAMFMGLQRARGEAVILIQADLQDPPELIPDFIRSWEEGFDVAYGKISQRSDPTWLKKGRQIYYRIIARFADVPIPTDAGDFRLTSRRALDSLLQFEEDNLYIRGAMALVGFPQKPVQYVRAPRAAGESSLSMIGLLAYALNGLLSTTVVPLRMVTVCGFLLAGLGFVLGFLFTILKIIDPSSSPRGLTAMGILITFFSGAQILSMGVIGEYVRKIYVQSLKRPRGFVQDGVNLGDSGTPIQDAAAQEQSLRTH